MNVFINNFSLGRKYRKLSIGTLLLAMLFTQSYFVISDSMVAVSAQDSSITSQLTQLQSQMSQLNDTISKEQSQIDTLNKQINSNQNTISNLTTIISQKQQLIADKQNQIQLLNQSIASQRADIAKITAKVTKLYAVFVQRAKLSYEDSYLNPIMLTLGNKSIVDVFANLDYFTASRRDDSKLLSEMKNNQYILNQKLNDLSFQQTNLTNAQNELVTQKASLLAQQTELQTRSNSMSAQGQAVKHQLSADQQKSAAVLDKINSLQVSSFTTGSCVAGNWWYFNQQCYGRLPGMYGTSIDMKVGCLITAIAMVATKELGRPITPQYVASQTYFSGDGYMAAWPSLPGISPTYTGYGLSAVSAELARGVITITYLGTNNGLGGHWVVFYGKSNGDYTINDPWYGSGESFYGTGGGTHENYTSGIVGASYVLQ